MNGFYFFNIELWEQNIIICINFVFKWEDMFIKIIFVLILVVDKVKYFIGVYEGGGYLVKGIYCLVFDCCMCINEYFIFCLVC